MTVVQTGAWWAHQQKLLLLAGDLHKRGELTLAGYLELSLAIAGGSYRAGIEHLMDSGVIPHNPELLRAEELPPPTLKA